MRKLLLLAALAAAPALASAQPAVQSGNLTYKGDQSSNGTIGGAKVGPYLANLSGYQAPLNATNAIIWCVDWDHSAPTLNVADSYTASRIFGAGTDLSNTRANNLLKYQQAAWLIEQLGTASMYTAGNIQGTLWQMFSGSAKSVGYSGSDVYTQQLTTPGAGTFALTRDWYVLSDCLGGQGCASNQEFLTSTTRITTNSVPEPGTYALLSAGLLAIGVMKRRRRVEA